jgi:orotate phosphoribosyltransferase
MSVLEDLQNEGAVYENGHYVYKSGKHGDKYVDLDVIFPNFRLVRQIGRQLAEPYVFGFDYSRRVEVIVVPAVGGIAIAYMMAAHFEDIGQSVDVVWADKAGNGFAFERAGFAKRLKGRHILVGEDILNTGGSVESVCRQAEAEGGIIVGASVVVSRGNASAESLSIPQLNALETVQFDAFAVDACPFCAEAKPIVADIGHGAKFKAENPDYIGDFVFRAT